MGVMAEAKRYLRLAVVMMGAVVLSTAALRADAADSSGDPVSAAEAWFDSITTMKADFTQVASDGTTATGELHFRRPHRMKIIMILTNR